MNELIIYAIKCLCISSFFALYYILFLRNKTFNSYNRFYILISVVLSLLLPFVNIHFNFYGENNLHHFTLQHHINNNDILQIQFPYAEAETNVKWYQKINAEDCFLLIYGIIVLIGLIVFAKGIVKILNIKKQNPIIDLQGIDFLQTNEKQAPFSFLKTIFWRNDIPLDDAEGKMILQHEMAHIVQKHTYDKLFMKILIVLFWFNPLFWYFQKELNMIHEFIADRKSGAHEHKAVWAATMLKAIYPKYNSNIFSPFFYSPLKRRLIMLTKISNPAKNYAVRISALLVFVLAGLFVCVKAKTISFSEQKTVLNPPLTDETVSTNQIKADGKELQNIAVNFIEKEYNKKKVDSPPPYNFKGGISNFSIFIDSSDNNYDKFSGFTNILKVFKEGYPEAKQKYFFGKNEVTELEFNNILKNNKKVRYIECNPVTEANKTVLYIKADINPSKEFVEKNSIYLNEKGNIVFNAVGEKVTTNKTNTSKTNGKFEIKKVVVKGSKEETDTTQIKLLKEIDLISPDKVNAITIKSDTVIVNYGDNLKAMYLSANNFVKKNIAYNQKIKTNIDVAEIILNGKTISNEEFKKQLLNPSKISTINIVKAQIDANGKTENGKIIVTTKEDKIQD